MSERISPEQLEEIKRESLEEVRRIIREKYPDIDIKRAERIVVQGDEIPVRRRLTERQRRDAALVAVKASHSTGDTLPRRVYEAAGVEVPDNATDVTQRAPAKRPWWRFWR